MNYRLTQSLPAQGKMAVTPEQSDALQRALFDMGYEWKAASNDVIKIGRPHYIIWYENREISWLTPHKLAINHPNPLCLFEDYF